MPDDPVEIIADKYRVDARLGAGAFGQVLAATHLQLGSRVAIKVLRPDGQANPQALERFLREARLAARLRSEHAARVVDFGALPDGSPFIIMELLDGEDLRSMLARRGPLPPAEVVDYMLQSCEALAEAHALGIIHRDVKPANLFIARRTDGSPLVKVLDFGISKQLSNTGEANLGITAGQSLLGSPQYMSPEQIISPAEVDARADVWSLGVTLYELSTGRLPFDASNLLELIAAILHNPAAPTTGSLPPALAKVLRICLEKERAQRYPHVAALAADLVPLGPADAAASAARIGRILKVATPPAGPQKAEPDAGPSGPWSRPRRRRRVAALFGTAALAAAAIGLWLSLRRPAPSTAPVAPTSQAGPSEGPAPVRNAEPSASPPAATAEVVPQPPRSPPPPSASAAKKRVPRRGPRPAAVDVFKDRL